MELHQEAGFHPIKIIQQATGNNAKILGQEEKLGRVRAGFLADLIVVNGIPYHAPTLMARVKQIVAEARRH
jgi:imidazolonepropionase-like amidohydrolase